MRTPLAACEASRLSAWLTDGELLVLMASHAVSKRGPTLRVFGERDLARRPVTGRLGNAGLTLRECLDGLLRKRMLVARGRRPYAATHDGNMVKHSFNDLHRLVRLKAPDAWRAPTVEGVAILRMEMRRRCHEIRRSLLKP